MSGQDKSLVASQAMPSSTAAISDKRAVERDGELLLELAEDLEREGCPCGQRLPRCGHLIALAKAAAFFCEVPWPETK